ncbi:ferredoxin [Roseobacter sp. YSTF-M11]|uniref:Ferredoxin n=1 Tax=Roseobacter insulae TaxID=2859783 RepID=A0A9X1K032_9RHOB|nr:ferredoxin [Roseobacter insulae]MBW4709875.1 ferredoxin [Roseobacter insulae]
MIFSLIEKLAAPSGLFVMGAFHPRRVYQADDATGTLVLLGADKTCWPKFTASTEYRDGAPDPLDRWSKRMIGWIANEIGAKDVYPSDGPPYAPFIGWALNTNRFFKSPTGMMVHDTAGLMISIRGALRFDAEIELPAATAVSPCLSCADQPCVTACPVNALSADHAYDVPACKAYLDTAAGQDCMTRGCKVRRACPVSQAFDRDPAQSAFHMVSFKG